MGACLNMVKILYEAQRTTQTKVRFRAKDNDEKPTTLRNHPAPYYYIGKKLWTEMGTPEVIRVTIEPVIPEVIT